MSRASYAETVARREAWLARLRQQRAFLCYAWIDFAAVAREIQYAERVVAEGIQFPWFYIVWNGIEVRLELDEETDTYLIDYTDTAAWALGEEMSCALEAFVAERKNRK